MEKIALVDVVANYKSIKEEIDNAIFKVIGNGSFILGKELENFEKNFANFCGTKYAIGVDSGTSALILALKALGIKEGDEVITVANTFYATVAAIVLAGAKPVLVDCDKNYLINTELIESKITEKTKVIIPVHLYGYTVDMDKINAIAKKYNLFVLEDACQAHGAVYKSKRAGNLADIAAFSFYPGKNLGAFGDGGIITTNSEELNEKLRFYRNYGQIKKYEHKYIGGNYRLDNLQAAILDVKLKYLDKWNQRRRDIAAYYTRELKNICICPPEPQANTTPVYHLYVIRVPNRDKILKELENNNIYAGIHYPISIPELEAFKEFGFNLNEYPLSINYSKEILSLPIYPELQDNQIERVITVLKNNL